MVKEWHSFSIKKTFQELKSDSSGLSQESAKQRLKSVGLNQLPQEKPFSRIKIFLEQFKSPLVYVLLAAGILALLLDARSDSAIIFGAVLLNTIVGYFQENKASNALGQLKKILNLKTVVFRDGQEKEVFQKEIVPGDVFLLRAGNKVPADARIIKVHNLKINEAILTGEWIPADKKTEILSKGQVLADRDNMVYMGTIVESGWGKMVVTGTGLKTEIGQVAGMIKEIKEKQTPYQKKLTRFSKIISVVIAVVSVLIFVEGMITGGEFVEMFTTSIAVAVAAIPEGLPVAMTVILALGMQRILKRKGLVRRLASAETLGSTSIILTDKTGTLTEAKMEVSGIFTQARLLALKIAMLCNESFIENLDEPIQKRKIRGSPTEKALFLAGIQAGLSRKKLEKEQPIIDQALFDSSYKYGASLHRTDSRNNILYLVGSPERLLSFSSYLETDKKTKKMLLSDLKKIKAQIDNLTKQGLRVVAVGYKKTKDTQIDRTNEEDLKEIVFVGVFALHDPIRRGVGKVLNLCRSAGMRPIIVTGDHKLTAKKVAEKLGFKIKPENILEGKNLAKLSDKEFKKKLKQIYVYARVEPAQKLRIVNAWQEANEIVAMTGDGINDAPALKQADIGIALGSGTDVTKEVADLVLLTDSN